MIEFMGDVTKLKSDPHRTANFRVLKSAHVPSVLIETAYVSNKKDAELLKSPKWRENLTKSLVTAIDNYFSHRANHLPI